MKQYNDLCSKVTVNKLIQFSTLQYNNKTMKNKIVHLSYCILYNIQIK